MKLLLYKMTSISVQDGCDVLTHTWHLACTYDSTHPLPLASNVNAGMFGSYFKAISQPPCQGDDSQRACLQLVSVHAPGGEDAGMQADQIPLSCNHTLVAG